MFLIYISPKCIYIYIYIYIVVKSFNVITDVLPYRLYPKSFEFISVYASTFINLIKIFQK